MNCVHDFIKIQPLNGVGKPEFLDGGRQVVCVYCAQVRRV
jgi:hypothetical protein